MVNAPEDIEVLHYIQNVHSQILFIILLSHQARVMPTPVSGGGGQWWLH